MEVPRWTLAELLTRYELEPTLTDVFVEGQYDKDILLSAYKHSTFEERAMYIADTVDISSDLFQSHHLTTGNKQKLIVLCRELSCVNQFQNLRFIVDRDVDHWIGDLEVGNGLVWTDFCDIETYFFEEFLVKELVEDAGKAKIDRWDDFYKSFCETLKFLFAVRIADKQENLHLSYPDFCRLLYIDSGIIKFKFEEYIDRTLNKNNASKERQKFLMCARDWIERLKGDPRMFCRGHDFIILMSWSILRYKGVRNFSDDVISRILLLLVPRHTEKFSRLLQF